MQISKEVKVLKAGGLVIYPTETCYGAGVDATNQKAVNKLLSYKAFRQGKPLSVAVSNQAMAEKYVSLNPTAKNLYTKFLPGPLTVISKGKGKLAQGIESTTNTLGIRIPDYPLIIKLITKLNRPITATSANASYKPRPYSIPQLLKSLSKKQQNLIDLIIDVGTLPKRPPSTIVDTTLDDPLILRQGKINLKSSPTITTKSPQETSKLAQTLMLKSWTNLQKQPLIFLLIGDLGTGKTQFAKGIGKFLGIKQVISSPTYTLEKEYSYTRHQISGLFLHLDTWRLQDITEFDQLNLSSRLKPKNILAIEWADRTLKPLLKLAKNAHAKIITIKLQTFSKSAPSSRRITVGPV